MSKKVKVVIREILEKEIELEDNELEVIRATVDYMYRDEIVVLTADDHVLTDAKIIKEDKIIDSFTICQK